MRSVSRDQILGDIFKNLLKFCSNLVALIFDITKIRLKRTYEDSGFENIQKPKTGRHSDINLLILKIWQRQSQRILQVEKEQAALFVSKVLGNVRVKVRPCIQLTLDIFFCKNL